MQNESSVNVTLTISYPGGTVITNTFTARSQLATITANGPPPLASFTYDAAGRRVSKTVENGTSTTYGYDDANRLLGLAQWRGTNQFAALAYTYNNVGNRTSRTESSAGFQPATDTYSYDATDQLTQVQYPAQSRTVSYAYDPLGNLTAKNDNGQVNGYTANALNQYTLINSQALTYDTKGNLLTRPGWQYTYDAQNRLLAAEPAAPATNSVKLTFAYDARNRCVERQTYTWASGNWSLITDYFLSYDGWNLIEERTATGTLLAAYVHGPRLDEVLARITPTNTVYFHHDALHSATHLTDGQGNVIEQYRYDAFGLPTILDATFSPLSSSPTATGSFFRAANGWRRCNSTTIAIATTRPSCSGG